MSELLWTKTISPGNIDPCERIILDEREHVPKPTLGFRIDKLELQCLRDVEFIPANPHHDELEKVTVKLKGIVSLWQTSYAASTLKVFFSASLYYSSGETIDNYATPGGLVFIPPSPLTLFKTWICYADNVKNYPGIVAGNLADKISFNTDIYTD